MKRFPLVLGLILCVPLVWNFMQPNFFHLHDFTHVARLKELEIAVHEGQIPPRWSANLGYGYGLPQFSFYGNMFYFEALLFRVMGISYIWSIKLAVMAQVFISFLALYGIGKILRDRWLGLVMGIAGIYAPYRLVDMYVRGAFGELTGISFLCMTLWFGLMWAKRPGKKQAVLTGMMGAGIILSHNLMALISAPFIAIWLLYWMAKEKLGKKYVIDLLIMAALAVGISAGYAVPALAEISFTQAGNLTSGFSNYNHHFLYIRQFWNSTWGYGGSIWGIDDNVSFQLGKIQIMLAIFVFLFYGISFLRRRSSQFMSFVVMVGMLLSGSLFMMILKSKFIWDALPFLAFIQFPWRYLSVAMVLIVLPLVGLSEFCPKKCWPLTSIILSLMLISSQAGNAKPESFLADDEALYYSDAQKIQTHMSGIIPDFLPIQAKPELLPEFAASNKFNFSPVIEYKTEINHNHEFLLNTEGRKFTSLVLGIFDFPGWTIYFDGQKVNHTTTREGLIEVTIDSANSPEFISGRFEETPIRLWSDIVSVFSLFMAGVVLWKPKK